MNWNVIKNKVKLMLLGILFCVFYIGYCIKFSETDHPILHFNM